MKTIISILVFINTLQSIAQETKRVEIEETREVYYVLKSDSAVKHGKYVRYFYKKKVEIEGFYKAGLKDSLWITYSSYGGMSLKGKYKNGLKTGEWIEYDNGSPAVKGEYYGGKKVGIWEYYDDKKLVHKYDHTNKILVYPKDVDGGGKEFKVINDNDTSLQELSRPPMYLGGEMAMFKSLYRNIKYPDIAKENGIQGKMIFSFVVDEVGNIGDFKFLRRVGGGCEEEVLRVAKEFMIHWIPGLMGDTPVRTIFTIPINFSLQ